MATSLLSCSIEGGLVGAACKGVGGRRCARWGWAVRSLLSNVVARAWPPICSRGAAAAAQRIGCGCGWVDTEKDKRGTSVSRHLLTFHCS
jgi:hypothetical protein